MNKWTSIEEQDMLLVLSERGLMLRMLQPKQIIV